MIKLSRPCLIINHFHCFSFPKPGLESLFHSALNIDRNACLKNNASCQDCLVVKGCTYFKNEKTCDVLGESDIPETYTNSEELLKDTHSTSCRYTDFSILIMWTVLSVIILLILIIAWCACCCWCCCRTQVRYV